MIRRRIYSVTCDEPGCDNEYIANRAQTGSQALADAEGYHWARVRVGVLWTHRCPEHKPA